MVPTSKKCTSTPLTLLRLTETSGRAREGQSPSQQLASALDEAAEGQRDNEGENAERLDERHAEDEQADPLPEAGWRQCGQI